MYLVVASPVHGDVPSLTTGNLSGQIIISTLNLNGLVFWYLGDSFYETTGPYLGEFPTNNFPRNPSTREMVSNHADRKSHEGSGCEKNTPSKLAIP